MGLKVDIGCGRNPRPGFLGLDIEAHGQQWVRDVRRGLPFADNTVSEVNLSHVLEHVHGGEDLYFFLSEIYRVCHHNAKVYIRVPHTDSKEAFDPSHLSYWNDLSMRFLNNTRDNQLPVPSIYYWDFIIVKEEINGIELYVEAKVNKQLIAGEVQSGKTSIIVVHYGELIHTKKCIESIQRWTKGIPYEIIIIDNMCNNETKDYFNSIEEKYDNVKVLYPGKNIGWIKGCNLGLENISEDSEFIIFSNNDIIITEDGWLQRLLNHFTEDTGAVGPTTNYVMGRQSVQYNYDGLYEEETNYLIGFFMCIRRKVVEEIGNLDERFGVGGADDLDYSIRIREAGYKLKIARDVYVHHSGSKSFMPYLGGTEEYNEYWQLKNKELIEKWGEGKFNQLFSHPVHIVCAVPLRTDYVHRLFAFRFAQMIKPFRWSLIDAPRGLIHDSRNALVKEAKRLQADYILFIDDDMIPPLDLFVRLYNHNTEVISALAFKRRPPYDPCIFKWSFDKKTGEIAATPLRGMVKRGVQRVDATGFGAIMIKMSVFETIPEPWFELKSLGEDLDFCLKCRDYGIPIYCDTDLIVQHIGDNELVDETSFYRAMEQQLEGNTVLEIHTKDKVERKLI